MNLGCLNSSELGLPLSVPFLFPLPIVLVRFPTKVLQDSWRSAFVHFLPISQGGNCCSRARAPFKAPCGFQMHPGQVAPALLPKPGGAYHPFAQPARSCCLKILSSIRCEGLMEDPASLLLGAALRCTGFLPHTAEWRDPAHVNPETVSP
jgi:hypothetical protein